MKIEHVKDYPALSNECTTIMIDTVKQNPCAKLVIATGQSPLEAYRIFVQRVKKEKIDVSAATFIKLDEWVGLEPEDPATCEYFIQEELIKPLGITKEHYIAFCGKAGDLQGECERIQQELDRIGEIDLTILGIGKNGHLGLNEPSDYQFPLPHVVELDKRTKTHAMLKETTHSVTRGLTLGMKDILSSKRIVLLVTGAEKEEAFQVVRKGVVTTKTPASFLNLHRNAVCFTDCL